MRRAIVILGMALLTGSADGHVQPALAPIAVPSVGCAADGQAGPIEAPRAGVKEIAIPPGAAERLAWYEGPTNIGSIGVLAPRGWHCFETYGSSGASLYVSPEQLGSKQLIFHNGWNGFEGPAIQLSVADGGTSGRFEVAKVIARVFPAHMDFVRNVIAENIEPASSFPPGPYPGDKLTYLSKEMVEFETPANTDGLGTVSWLRKNSSPIRGVAMLAEPDTSLLQLSVRLPGDQESLALPIIREMEVESAQPPPSSAE